jgi:hypothetical protein
VPASFFSSGALRLRPAFERGPPLIGSLSLELLAFELDREKILLSERCPHAPP